MKICAFKMNKTDFVHGYRFHRLFRGLLYGFLCVCTGLFLSSCAPKAPQGTYLKNMSLTGISKVAVLASVSSPKVSYSTAKPNVSEDLGGLAAFPPAMLVILAATGAQTAMRSGIDHGHAGEIKEHMDLSHFEDKVAQSFIQPLEKGGCFQITEYLSDKNHDVQQLSTRGYNAVVRLFVHQISLKRFEGDSLRLDVYVRGQMEQLPSRKVVWDREEYVKSPELHPLGYYKENGLKELDAMLEKAGRNLAYDFVYLK